MTATVKIFHLVLLQFLPGVETVSPMVELLKTVQYWDHFHMFSLLILHVTIQIGFQFVSYNLQQLPQQQLQLPQQQLQLPQQQLPQEQLQLPQQHQVGSLPYASSLDLFLGCLPLASSLDLLGVVIGPLPWIFWVSSLGPFLGLLPFILSLFVFLESFWVIQFLIFIPGIFQFVVK